MNRRKVCHITTVHPPKDVRIYYKECLSLSDEYDVSLIVVGSDMSEEGDVNIIGLDKSFPNRVARFLKSGKEAYQAALQLDADIYHFHDPEFLRHANKLRRKGKKVIYDVHEDLPRQILAKYYLPTMVRKPLSFLSEKLEDYFAKRMTAVVTATEHIADRFKKVNKNSYAIHNYPMLDQLPEPVDFSQKKNQVCYVGALASVRGIPELVIAIEMTKARLALGGKFNETGLRKGLTEMKGWKQVDELGFVDREMIKTVLSDSRVGLVTLKPAINYLDALPVKMFEYMAAGIPVVASDFPVWRNIVEKHNCGICVNPNDPEDIAKAINSLLEDEVRSAAMGLNGRKAVEEIFNWAKESENLKRIYSSI